MRYFIIIFLIMLSPAIYCQDSYHDTIVSCKIIENISARYNEVYNGKLKVFKSFTGRDTIALLSRVKDTIPSDSYVRLEVGKTYKVLLKYVPAEWDLENDDYKYEKRKDSITIWMTTTYNVIGVLPYYKLYNEQAYFGGHLSPDEYLFYFSPMIIDQYVPKSTLVE